MKDEDIFKILPLMKASFDINESSAKSHFLQATHSGRGEGVSSF